MWLPISIVLTYIQMPGLWQASIWEVSAWETSLVLEHAGVTKDVQLSLGFLSYTQGPGDCPWREKALSGT